MFQNTWIIMNTWKYCLNCVKYNLKEVNLFYDVKRFIYKHRNLYGYIEHFGKVPWSIRCKFKECLRGGVNEALRWFSRFFTVYWFLLSWDAYVMKSGKMRKIKNTTMYSGSPHRSRVLHSPFNMKENSL